MGAEIGNRHATQQRKILRTSTWRKHRTQQNGQSQNQNKSSQGNLRHRKKEKRTSQMKQLGLDLHVNLRRRRNNFMKSGRRIFFWLEQKGKLKHQNQVKKYRPTNLLKVQQTNQLIIIQICSKIKES